MTEDHHHPASEAPWFLRDRSNFVDISYMTEWIKDDHEGIAKGSLNVPKDAFDAMLERAAKHRGYFGNQHDVHEIVTRDAVLNLFSGGMPQNLLSDPPAGDPQKLHQNTSVSGTECARARVISKHLVEARPFEGTPLLVRTYQRTVQPFSAFPCDAPVYSKRKVRRLDLKVHRDARLVFETMISDTGDVMSNHRWPEGPALAELPFGKRNVVRRVYLEIEKRGGQAPDLRRTIENTIQVVLLGMTPQGKGVQMGQQKSKSGLKGM
jgi:hypothetical protein